MSAGNKRRDPLRKVLGTIHNPPQIIYYINPIKYIYPRLVVDLDIKPPGAGSGPLSLFPVKITSQQTNETIDIQRREAVATQFKAKAQLLRSFKDTSSCTLGRSW